MDAGLSRRSALGLAVLAGVGGLASGCAPGGDPGPLVVATGGPAGVYSRLGEAMARLWRAELGTPARAVPSEGSVDNVGMLRSGRAQVGFCAADVAVDAGRLPLRALARLHDDAIQVVVPAESPIRRLADLRGRRVAVGAPSSGVRVVAPRLLATVGLDAERDLAAVPLALAESVTALARGDVDAFFWSGGVPTSGVEALAATRPVRLLDLAAETAALRPAHPVYDLTTVPARTYGLSDPVAATSVRNVLLVGADMPDSRAETLTRTLLAGRDQLARADPSGRSIDPRSAIGTQPVPLHPGAIAAYRALKGL